MSDEDRPARPAAPSKPEPAAKTDAPREPAKSSFSEVDALLQPKLPVGPAPDHASEYVPPRELPKETRHKTIEDLRVRIREEADARRAKTQKLPPRAQYVPSQPAPPALPRQMDQATIRLHRPRNPPRREVNLLPWLISASVVVVAFVVAAVVIYRMRMPDTKAPEDAVQPVAAPVTPTPATVETPSAPVEPTSTASAAPSTSVAPAPTAPKPRNRLRR